VPIRVISQDRSVVLSDSVSPVRARTLLVRHVLAAMRQRVTEIEKTGK
jgi:hypothetical protein